MKVYRQNVEDVVTALHRAVTDMETLERMYPLTAPIALQEAVVYAKLAQLKLEGLRRSTYKQG